jgi:hypothetical protein
LDERKRLQELIEQIATEQDAEKFAKLVAEFNRIIDEEKPRNPPSKPSSN